jgi:predicted small metal-binding protein
MPEEHRAKLRLTCPPCGEIFTAANEDSLIAIAVEHARKFHDIDLIDLHGSDELRALVRRENGSYWARIAHLIPEGKGKQSSTRSSAIASAKLSAMLSMVFLTARLRTVSASANVRYRPIW